MFNLKLRNHELNAWIIELKQWSTKDQNDVTKKDDKKLKLLIKIKRYDSDFLNVMMQKLNIEELDKLSNFLFYYSKRTRLLNAVEFLELASELNTLADGKYAQIKEKELTKLEQEEKSILIKEEKVKRINTAKLAKLKDKDINF